MKKKHLILFGVLAVSVVTLILGLGLGLGLDLQTCRKQVAPQTSCRGRCYQPYDDATPGCRCDSGCGAVGSCCHDYHDLCTAPSELWECTRLRCGEARLPTSRCHCSGDCMSAHDCCTNYQHVCLGQAEWVEDQCDDMSRPSCPPGFKQQPLLLVSLDGLRADYLQTWSALVPVLTKLRTCGTSASFMQAAFPSKTFPNHYTIVTGLYPESNGLIDNVMYDPVMDAIFTLSGPEKDNPDWYLGQPIWHTAKFQGLKSGTFFWPGSDVKINGSFPDLYRPYDGKIPFEERVLTLLKWFQLPEHQRPDFFTLYLEEPDKSGHSFGPVSGGVVGALMAVDKIVGQLMNGLKQLDLHGCVNIIILADHGMEETSCDRKEALEDLVGDVSGLWVTEGPFGRVRSKDKDVTLDAAELVANMTCKKDNQKLRPYLKSHLPKRLHFANSRRIEDVNVLVEPKWLFERLPGSLTFCSGGAHGYDNDAHSMHAMFVSHGPKFNSRLQVEPFSNIELYNLMCDVLEILPSDNNGTHGSMNHFLREPFYSPLPPLEQSGPAQCSLTSLQPTDQLGCSCPTLSADDVITANRRLNLTSTQESALVKKHAMFGRPRVLRPEERYCVLHHQAYVSAYSQDAMMPLWTSFTLDKTADLLPVEPDCLRPDVRLPASQSRRCDHYGDLRPGFLYPPRLSGSEEQRYDALLSSQVAPMYPHFLRVWSYFQHTLLRKYAAIYNGINVLTGPAFDHDHDGRHDAQWASAGNGSAPTHFFAVLTSCKDVRQPVSACDGELHAIAFLLPHRPDNSENCQSAQDEAVWVEEHIWFHQSRVRDVEWMTGLDLYQDSPRPITELLQLKTRPTAANQKPIKQS
nr:venom phosphodiesterase-like [Nerophis lumbriciformis]